MLMRQAFAETFSVRLLDGALTPEEEAAATSIAAKNKGRI
jgi:hypothetical protein